MFVEAVEGLASGAIVPQPQPDDTSLHLRCYPRRPEDSRIVWAEPAEMILRLVRASSRPFDGAFGFLEGQRKVTIWRAEHEIARGSFLAVPGQVCYRSGDDPVIACTDGLIRLTEVEVEGCAGSAAGKALIHDSLRNRLT
jgi:methionyl-tRNA formyltransferase